MKVRLVYNRVEKRNRNFFKNKKGLKVRDAEFLKKQTKFGLFQDFCDPPPPIWAVKEHFLAKTVNLLVSFAGLKMVHSK